MMTVEQAWEMLLQKNAETKEAIEALKKAIKDDKTQHIQEFIQSEDFASATRVLDDLNVFTKVKYVSNLEDIEKALHTVMDKVYESTSKEEEIAEIAQRVTEPAVQPTAEASALIEKEVAIAVETKGLTSEEEAVIRIIGYSGVSRVKDGNKIQAKTAQSLIEKGFLKRAATNNTLSFELSAIGRAEFQALEGIEANPSFLREIEMKQTNLDQGYFIYDLENAIQEKGFKIENFEGDNLDISRDNYYYYLTVDSGKFTKNDYFEILEEKHRLKSIGFICINDAVLGQTKAAVSEWVAANKSKCRFMSIHYATCEKMETAEAQSEFEVLAL